MTRQNVTDGPREILTAKCPTCGGDGIVLSAHTTAIDAERRLRDLARNARRGVEAFRVELEEDVASHLVGPGASRLTEIEALAKRRFFLEGKAGVPVDHFHVLAQGKLADIAPKAPVEEGAELRVALVEVGLHDVDAGIGKLDGLSVCVADASKLVGKKVKVRIERVLDGTAYATLVQPAAKVAEGPITAESEAEKPTRAPRKKKPAEKSAPEAEAPEVPMVEVEPAAEETPEVGEEPPKPAAQRPVRASGPGEGARGNREVSTGEQEGDGAEEAPKRKRTRRGSRGGRGRKKKTAAATGTDNGKPEAEAATATATIHVPSPDLGHANSDPTADGEQPPKKKRTRRGSRGGRNRRKKTAAATADPKPESSGG
jgi:predicted RNA-binding protein with TRAM domain